MRATPGKPVFKPKIQPFRSRTVRLNSIKLSGFKSFAEPTNFLLPGQLVGVVGPCFGDWYFNG